MKIFWSFIVLIVTASQVQAITLQEQLVKFNSNWGKYNWAIPNLKMEEFKSDKAYIKAHLFGVLRILKSHSTSHLNKQQLANRERLLNVLTEYKKEGKFPINYNSEKRTPVFIDENKTHCAVGYLLQQSGQEELALSIADHYNYNWLKDIHDVDFVKWQQNSGLSMEELMLIQGAYDYYMPRALYMPNKHEIPQKPEVLEIAFKNASGRIWVKGEGKDGILHGQWTQNYSKDLPWIVGFFENGNRTGQWKEYYQGTEKICRTENWRNDKLNGVRKRFNRDGVLIEEILFKDGKAIRKTNYDLFRNIRTERVPVDSNEVDTKIFTQGGGLLAQGKERIHNTSGLEWFQDIELTALNSFSVTSREQAYDKNDGGSAVQLYNQPNLVQYHKVQNWVFYKQFNPASYTANETTLLSQLKTDYAQTSAELIQGLTTFSEMENRGSFDSLLVAFENNQIRHFKGYGNNGAFVHLVMTYHKPSEMHAVNLQFLLNPYNPHYDGQLEIAPTVKSSGELDTAGRKIATWKHYDRWSRLYKTEQFLIPYKEEELEIVHN